MRKRRRNHESHEFTRIKDQASRSATLDPLRRCLPVRRTGLCPGRPLSLFVLFVLFVVPPSFSSVSPCYAAPAESGDELVLLPASARLVGPHARQRFVVERSEKGIGVGDLTGRATFAVDNPRVAVVDRDGFVQPVGDGLATITATVDGRVARGFVSVEGADRDEPWSFRNHVEAVLTRQGCNAGACHGAAAGKNGFRLTLRGYGPEIDYATLTRQSLGRRVVKTAPQESLVLLKPTGAIEHGGGVRFQPGSLEYRVIAEWIAGGMPGPSPTDPEIRGLSIHPGAVRLAPGQFQQVVVQATYSDGRVEDVTHWAKFASTDDAVASVDDHGRLKVTGRGEGYVSVWFASRVARVTVTSPFEAKLDPRVLASAPRNNAIDEKNLAKLAALSIPPSPDAGDAAFLRRACLDATGTLPTVQQAEAFLNDRAPDRRARLVNRLLESPEYVDYWAYKWSDMLLVSSRKLAAPSMWSFYRFVRQSVEQDVPWDRFARSILTAQGSTLSNGAAAFYVMHRDPIELSESASMTFLGLSLTCAVPQPPAREMDAGPVLQLRQPVRPGRAQGRGHDRRCGGGELARRGDPAPSARGGDAAEPARCPADGVRRPARPPRGARRLAGPAGQPVFRPRAGQPGLEQLLRPRIGEPRGRPAGLEPAQRRGAPRRAGRRLHRPPLRREAPGPHDHELGRVCPVERAGARQ